MQEAKIFSIPGRANRLKDIVQREEKREKYKVPIREVMFVVKIDPFRLVTVAELFYQGCFHGAGVAVRNPLDTYYEEHGIRLAVRRALHNSVLPDALYMPDYAQEIKEGKHPLC